MRLLWSLPLKSDVEPNWINTNAGEQQLGMQFKHNTNFTNNVNKYHDKITIEALREVEDTHILGVTNFFTKLIAVLFGMYPCNLFSNAPFSKKPYQSITSTNGKTKTIANKDVLLEKLDQLETNFYIKYLTVRKIGLSFKGHTMLIKNDR